MVTINVYGAEKICSSCLNAPSSRETFDWVQAAVSRKFPEYDQFQFIYVDILKHSNLKEQKYWIKQIHEEDLFYPIVVIDDQFICEGNPKIKLIYKFIEQKINADT